MLKTTIKTNRPLLTNRHRATQTIADVGNKTAHTWNAICGLHMHHGYYENNLYLRLEEAQETLIDKLAVLLNISSKDSILDVGCGIGGSSLYLARKYQSSVTGITLSQTQMTIAIQQSVKTGTDNVSFYQEDALSLSRFSNDSFDILWSLESCEQFYDKNEFIKQAVRVLKPGGKLLLATCCSEKEEYSDALAEDYIHLCLAFNFPFMPTMTYYESLLKKQNLAMTQLFDWSSHVKKTWRFERSLVNAFSLLRLITLQGLGDGFRVLKRIKMMRDAFNHNRVRYGVFLATKC